MSNSPLVNYTKISPYKNSPRNHKIDTITIHCAVGQCLIPVFGAVFNNPDRPVSANYGIAKDGKIGLFVDEKDRSWCSSNAANDNRAITIEVASDTTPPYAVTDAAYKSLINLLTDICRRNNIKELKWKADRSLIGQVDKQNMTVHRWFANKSCPGEYLYSRHGQIAKEVNARLGKSESSDKVVSSKEVFRIRKTWIDSKTQKGAFTNLDNAIKCAERNAGYSVFNNKGERIYTPVKPYVVRVSIMDLNIRKGPGTNYDRTGNYTGRGSFTIVAEADGSGSKKGWGKLKSGGWISLDYVKKV